MKDCNSKYSVFREYSIFNIQCSIPSGFTLIEILVAVSILGISLAVILQLFSGGLRSGRLSDQYTRAIFHGREKMEEILLSPDLTEGDLGGEFDDAYRWRARIVRIEPDEDEKDSLPFDTYEISVKVMWNQGEKEKEFRISTMDIVEKPRDDQGR